MQREARKAKKFFAMAIFALTALLLGVVFLTEAEETSDDAKPKVKERINTHGKLRIEGCFWGGGGGENQQVGTAITKEEEAEIVDVTISGGGGIGGTLNLGYGISSTLEIDLTVGYQNSTLQAHSSDPSKSIQIEDAEGNFGRTVLLVTPKLKIPILSSGQLKFGVGVGYYMPKNMDLDFSEVPDGAHNIYNYDSAAGFHITGEYEHFLSKYRNWSLGIGLKYYKVTYELTSLRSNGLPVLLMFAPDEFRKLDGSGVDLTLSAATYF